MTDKQITAQGNRTRGRKYSYKPRSKRPGVLSTNVKLTEDVVTSLYKEAILYKQYAATFTNNRFLEQDPNILNYQELAVKYKTSYINVSNIVNHRTWKHLTIKIID